MRLVGRSRVFTAVLHLLFATVSTGMAAEVWPVPAPQWPSKSPDDHPAFLDGGFEPQTGAFLHRTVLTGGLIASPGPGLFFSHRWELDDFIGPRHVIDPGVHILQRRHLLRAMEDISDLSDGGKVADESFGPGYVLWMLGIDDHRLGAYWLLAKSAPMTRTNLSQDLFGLRHREASRRACPTIWRVEGDWKVGIISTRHSPPCAYP